MNITLNWSAIDTLITAVLLIFIAIQVRLQTKTHVVEVLNKIHSRWNEEAMLRARLHVCSNYLAGSYKYDGVAIYIAELIEEVGLYVRISAVSPEAVWEAKSWYFEHYYCMFREDFINERELFHDENLYDMSENLFKLFTKMSRKKGSPATIRSKDDLKKFAKDEVDSITSFLNLKLTQMKIQ